MDTPLITWICIAAIALLIITIRSFESFRRHSGSSHSHRIIELAHEREEFFIPGDPCENDDTYNDND